MKQKYELVAVLSSVVKEDARDKFVEKMEKTVKALDGMVSKTQEMGKKQLAYTISNQKEAYYIDMIIELPAASVIQLEKKLTVDKELLRHLLIKHVN